MKTLRCLALSLLLLSPSAAQVAPVATGPAAPTSAAPTGAGGAPATGRDEAPLEEIAAVRNGILEAMNKGDLDGVMRFLHPEIVVTWANAEVSHGPAGVRAYYDKMMTGSNRIVASLKINPTIEGRKMYGPNTLISYGSLGDEYKLTDGSDFTMNARFSSLMVKEDGRWLIKGFHSSGNLFDNPVMWIAVKRTAMWVGIIAGAAGALVGFILARLMKSRANRAGA